MSELFKSKVGWLLAGIHLLIFLFCLIDFYLINSFLSLWSTLIGMILTAPWNVFTTSLALKLSDEPGKGPGNEYQLLFIIGIVISALINAFILYLLGFLLTKAFNYLSSIKPKP